MEFTLIERSSSIGLNFFIKDIKPVLIYYVCEGRNAWHSTWVQQYSQGCMHATIDSAKNYCESKRTKGTLFTIATMPALAFISGESCLAITEINTGKIFEDFDFKVITQITNLFPLSSLAFIHFYHIFKTSSPLWSADHPTANSTIILKADAASNLIALKKEAVLVKYESRSYGGGYKLGWHEKKKINIDFNNVFNLASSLSGRLSKGSTVVLKKN